MNRWGSNMSFLCCCLELRTSFPTETTLMGGGLFCRLVSQLHHQLNRLSWADLGTWPGLKMLLYGKHWIAGNHMGTWPLSYSKLTSDPPQLKTWKPGSPHRADGEVRMWAPLVLGPEVSSSLRTDPLGSLWDMHWSRSQGLKNQCIIVRPHLGFS